MEYVTNRSKSFFVALLVFSTLLGGAGQVLFKAGLSNSGYALLTYIVMGFVVYGISTLAYFYALGRKNLSWAYSFGGLSYIFASIMAYFLLGESISELRWLGILIIAAGTVLIGFS